MNVIHVLKDGAKVGAVTGYRLNKEKTEQVMKIISEVKKGEKKDR